MVNFGKNKLQAHTAILNIVQIDLYNIRKGQDKILVTMLISGKKYSIPHSEYLYSETSNFRKHPSLNWMFFNGTGKIAFFSNLFFYIQV